jgi:YccS/YhfK family integral membrane protein
MAVSWMLGHITLVIPLFLGVIAGALAETDDGWRGRLAAVVITVLLFALSSFVTEILTPYPWLFLGGIVASTFTFSMAGALGERYAATAQATLILAVYTMLGLEQGGGRDGLWQEPVLLTAGAAWYGALSVLWQLLFARQPVDQGLALLFDRLGGYLKDKSRLLEPSRRLEGEAIRVDIALGNGRVVVALNQMKEILRARLAGRRGQASVGRSLSLFFLAQDIHERASSIHYPYEAFAESFFHSDVMFRCQHLLFQQGAACQALARAIRRGEPFEFADSRRALADVQRSVAYLQRSAGADGLALLPALRDLVDNLTALEAVLVRAAHPDALPQGRDNSLFDGSPRSLMDAGKRIWGHLTPSSPVFRHALRLTIALSAGYGVKSLVHPALGYWILLTTLFVCLPSYASTHQRLWQRLLGTAMGLVGGWALMTLFPMPEVQRLFAVVFGVAFFVWRSNRYSLATAAITLMVVCCFNQVVDGRQILLPRLTDTVMGSVIAGLVVVLVLPDWQGRQLHRIFAATLSASGRYLREVLRQYETGKDDDLAYRVVRRNAHDADAALSTTLANMLGEPGRYRKDAEFCLRHLVMSHTVLGYISALGAHRGAAAPLDAAVQEAARGIADALAQIARDLEQRRPVSALDGALADLSVRLDDGYGPSDKRHRFLKTQLLLICRQLAPIRALAVQLQQPVAKGAAVRSA